MLDWPTTSWNLSRCLPQVILAVPGHDPKSTKPISWESVIYTAEIACSCVLSKCYGPETFFSWVHIYYSGVCPFVFYVYFHRWGTQYTPEWRQDGRAVQGAAFRSQSPLEAWVRIPLLTSSLAFKQVVELMQFNELALCLLGYCIWVQIFADFPFSWLNAQSMVGSAENITETSVCVMGLLLYSLYRGCGCTECY